MQEKHCKNEPIIKVNYVDCKFYFHSADGNVDLGRKKPFFLLCSTGVVNLCTGVNLVEIIV